MPFPPLSLPLCDHMHPKEIKCQSFHLPSSRDWYWQLQHATTPISHIFNLESRRYAFRSKSSFQVVLVVSPPRILFVACLHRYKNWHSMGILIPKVHLFCSYFFRVNPEAEIAACMTCRRWKKRGGNQFPTFFSAFYSPCFYFLFRFPELLTKQNRTDPPQKATEKQEQNRGPSPVE